MSEQSSTRIWLLAGGALLVVVALVVVALARGPVELDPTTPEGTVQAYLQAISDKDYETALAMVDPDAENCTPGDIAYAAPQDPFSATLLETTVSGDTAIVEVSIRFGSSPGPFEPGDRGFGEVFHLEDRDGVWVIVGTPWPYFEWRCEEP